jgi:NAD(P)H-nitrite reductase large subunit
MSEEAPKVRDSVNGSADSATRYVIIGNGAAGNEAAWHLRQRDPASRITLITGGKLLFLSRYDFPRLVDGVVDWRELLVHFPQYYEDQRITVRRNTWVTRVDPQRRILELAHKESMAYDKLLVASGGSTYLPEYLSEFKHLLHDFGSYQNAVGLREALPSSGGGKVVMLGGDIKGLDLARTLLKNDHEVIIVVTEQLFWPHEITQAEELYRYISALEHMGMQIIVDRKVAAIEEGSTGMRPRRVIFEGGEDLYADVVMPFYGVMPALNFMMGTGVDVARGLLVNTELRTVNEYIWAAGDVCQIWSPEENSYRFYYGWNNVKMMGRIAAVNMTGGNESVSTFQEDRLLITEQGNIDSTLWEHD